MRKILISDFTIKQFPNGGSEWVNQVLIEKLNVEFQYSQLVESFDPSATYIISNISTMKPDLIRQIPNLNYIILEHDYKICESRHPWRWPNSIIPINERINYDLYKNAKAVFVQTKDHQSVYESNNVEANFINLHSSIWSDEDLTLLKRVLNNNIIKNGKSAIYDTNNWIKNTKGSIKYCTDNSLKYELIPVQQQRKDFLNKMAKCSNLVFFPIARETFCRLVVEARCLDLNVITTRNYGASVEDYFDLSGETLIEYLKNQTSENINKINEFLI